MQFRVLKVRLSVYLPFGIVVLVAVLSGLLTHTESLWLAGQGFNLYFTVPHGFPWTPHGLLIVLMESSWSPHGVLMESPWSPHGVPMESSWTPHGLREICLIECNS